MVVTVYGTVFCVFIIIDAIASYTAGSPQDTMDFYIARVGWWADGAVMVQVLLYAPHAQCYLHHC